MKIKNIFITILLCINASIIQAQIKLDTLYNAKAILEHNNMYKCFMDTNYQCFDNYMMPELKEYVKKTTGKELLEITKNEMQNLSEVKFGENKTVGVIQSIKTKNGYQKILKSYLEMKLNETNFVGVSYTLGVSTNGTDWKFMRLKANNKADLRKVFPFIDARFKIPKVETLMNKTIKDIEKKHKTLYVQ